MPLSLNTEKKLEGMLSNILRGSPFKEWAEEETSKLLELSSQLGPPSNLTDKILKIRKIVKINPTKDLPVWGCIRTCDQGFEIQLRRNGNFSPYWYRFNLAHEISHTLFYDLNHCPPSSLIYLEPGNRDLENICAYLARCLLIPRDWLKDKLKDLASSDSDSLSLKNLIRLEKIFQSPCQLIAQRLVEDIDLWHCILLNFVLLRDETEVNSEKRYNWRLNWYMVPPEIKQKVFIPKGKKIGDVKKYPRAQGAFAKFITEIIETKPRDLFFSKMVNPRIFNSSTTGNLGKFLVAHFGVNPINVNFAIRDFSSNELFNNIESKGGLVSIMMCFPLDVFKT